MRKLATGTLFAGAAAAAAIALSAPPAFAATFQVTGGGAITGSAGVTTLVVHNADGDVTLECDTSDATGNVPNAAASNGTPIGTITSLNFNDCLLGGSLSFTVNTNADTNPWNLNVASESGGVSSGAIPSGISANITGLLCNIDVSGPANTNDGSVPATYDNGTNELVVDGGGNLTVHNVSSGECLGLIDNGDSAEFFASYSVDPGVQIVQTG